jgi:CheY-like chemotaxis protein
MLASGLRQSGHEVVASTDGAAALAEFRRRPFDVVLTDLGMPGISGLEVCRAVKAVAPATLVGLVTGWGHSPDIRTGDAAGADFLIAKPYRIGQVRQKIAQFIAAADRSHP